MRGVQHPLEVAAPAAPADRASSASPFPAAESVRAAPPPSVASSYPVERWLLQADALALALRCALERVCVPLARAAAAFARDRGWTVFGFARLNDHARERFGRSGRWVNDLAALGDALESLPRLALALTGEDGQLPLGRVAALLVARVASPSSLSAWVALAREIPVRDLRAATREARAAGSDWSSGAVPPEARDAEPSSVTAPRDGYDDPCDRSLVRIPVPAPVLAAFDEVLGLYRSIEGTEASVTSFVEALVAESLAGAGGEALDPKDAARVTLRRGADLARVESALARSTGCWSHLPPSSSASWALALAGQSLARLEQTSREAGAGGPTELDAQIRALLALENEMEGRLGSLLAEMAERGAWPRLRFAGTGHYAEQRLGLSRTAAEDRARASRALRRFPLLRDAYITGRVGLDAALLVLRVLGDGPVDENIERAWLARAESATIKRLRDEALVLKHRTLLGRRGPAVPDEEGASATATSPAPLDDAVWHASLRRAPGTARARVFQLGTVAVAWADSDGALPSPDVFLSLRLPDSLAEDFLVAIEGSRSSLSMRVDAVPWDEPWPDPAAPPSVLAARTFSERSRRVPAWIGLLALLEDFVLTWDGDARASDRAQAATERKSPKQHCPGFEGVPRRHGDAVYIRDGWRCTAPGCTSRRNLEDHHLVYRSHLGTDNLSNRTCLCRFHHSRGEHGSLASCSGTAPLGVDWRLGRPDVAAWYRNERRVAPPR